MEVLVLCGDRWHPGEVVIKGLEPLGKYEINFEAVENVGRLTLEGLERYPVVILSKSNNISSTDESPWITEEAQEAILAYVRQGGSLFVIHSGTAGYDEAEKLRSLMGGIFTHHPEQCEVTTETLKGHTIVESGKAFTEMDEHYHVKLDDPNVHIFMRTSSKHGSQPGGWTRTEGDGRVCVITPGHNLEVWLNPVFQEILKNCIDWCTE
ncbi:MAG: ThuA domain-containing protein [Bacillota bacterium]|nr:ThuA domain-containing protein [Bacillota bacterium]